MKRVHIPLSSGQEIVKSFLEVNFPLSGLLRNPISIIEGIVATKQGALVPVCARNCIGCSADSLHPSNIESPVKLLTPGLFNAILFCAGKLAKCDYEIISLSRLNMFSGSNELDHPYCLDFRKLISTYFLELHGHPVGSMSSDLRFHISSTKLFKRNLAAILEQPTLFDNICVSIDEQIPYKNKNEYDKYLDTLAWVWDALKPALRKELEHADDSRSGAPRVIVNLLLPSKNNTYRSKYSLLYPTGPRRATSYAELVNRYVVPFVGEVERREDPIPSYHLFTNGVGTLKNIPGSRIFISEATFEPVGRAPNILETKEKVEDQKWYAPCVRTKIYPYEDSSFVIRAHLAPYMSSDAEIPFLPRAKPEWISRLEDVVIDMSEYME